MEHALSASSCSKAFRRLMERCFYFGALMNFYSYSISYPLVIEIPEQPYLSEKDCFYLISILSKVKTIDGCWVQFRKFSLEGLVFFTSYFQCNMILDYLVSTMWEDKNRILSILRLSKYFFGLRDPITRSVLGSLSNYLNVSDEFVLNLVRLQESEGPNCAMRALSKKMRDTSRVRRLLYSYFKVACASCKTTIVFNYKGACDTKAVFLKCCMRPIHNSPCLESFILDSFLRVRASCPYCRTDWIRGHPDLDTTNRAVRLQEYLTSVREYPYVTMKLHSDTFFKKC